MKLPVLPVALLVLLFSGCGTKPPIQNGSDKTPPGFIVTIWRGAIGTPNRGSGLDLSTNNSEMKLGVGQNIRVEIQVIDLESGVRDVKFVTKEIVNQPNTIQGNLSWSCEGSRPLTGVLNGSVLKYNSPLANPNLAASFRAELIADPYGQATCGSNGYKIFEGWIQVEATNGDGLKALSGELHFEKP